MGVVAGDSTDDDEQFDCVSNWCKNESLDTWLSFPVPDVDNGVIVDVNVLSELPLLADENEYSNGFVIAIKEFNISGVRGVCDISIPNKGVDKLVFKLNIFALNIFFG